MPQKKFEVGETVYWLEQYAFMKGQFSGTEWSSCVLSVNGWIVAYRYEKYVFRSLEELVQYYTEKLNQQK